MIIPSAFGVVSQVSPGKKLNTIKLLIECVAAKRASVLQRTLLTAYICKHRLTAFVPKMFCLASKFDGVQIDENVICLAIKWLIQNQRSDGAFPEVHHLARGGW